MDIPNIKFGNCRGRSRDDRSAVLSAHWLSECRFTLQDSHGKLMVGGEATRLLRSHNAAAGQTRSVTADLTVCSSKMLWIRQTILLLMVPAISLHARGK